MEIMWQSQWSLIQEHSRTQGMRHPAFLIFSHASYICKFQINFLIFVVCRDDVRMITASLPVSPCSSPLRQYGPAHRSCFLSPPHPAYALVGQAGYTVNDYSSYPTRPNTIYTHDPFIESSLLKAQTSGTSPRTRPIWGSVNTNTNTPHNRLKALWTGITML